MKAGCILLVLSLLAGVAADGPRPDTATIEVLKVARKYQPEGCMRSQVTFNAARDVAYVRYLAVRDGRDVAVSVLTLRKTAPRWIVDSDAR